MTASRGAMRTSAAGPSPLALLRAAHLGPTVAVTVLVAVLAAGRGLAAVDAVLVTAAVFTGQLTIGWVNDLVDLRRDVAVGRRDKPLVNGELSPTAVEAALLVASLATVALSITLGWRSALVHLLLVVGAGQAYNLGLKATPWSWAPYAVAFGALPAVVTLASADPAWPPWWLMLAGSILGVAAHFLNVLPDLADDASTGVRGLPHRLGETASRVLATLLLVAASAAALTGPDGGSAWWTALVAGLVAVLALVSLLGRGKTPFRAAIAIALLAVVLVATG
jgi:4-hydroxybenzoate polyprenyltransferase